MITNDQKIIMFKRMASAERNLFNALKKNNAGSVLSVERTSSKVSLCKYLLSILGLKEEYIQYCKDKGISAEFYGRHAEIEKLIEERGNILENATEFVQLATKHYDHEKENGMQHGEIMERLNRAYAKATIANGHNSCPVELVKEEPVEEKPLERYIIGLTIVPSKILSTYQVGDKVMLKVGAEDKGVRISRIEDASLEYSDSIQHIYDIYVDYNGEELLLDSIINIPAQIEYAYKNGGNDK